MNWQDFTLKLGGALLIYGIGWLILNKAIKPRQSTWKVLLILFASIFIYMHFFVDKSSTYNMVLTITTWGIFGLALDSFKHAKGHTDNNA